MSEQTSILIVEDEQIVASDIQKRLQYLGYKIIGSAESSEEALSLVKSKQPDLILMDIKLKGKTNGIKTAEIIKDIYDVPVIYVTAYANSNNLAKIKATDHFGIISKPFSDKDLLNVIETALHKFNMEQDLKEKEQTLSAVYNSSPTVIIISTIDEGRYIKVNKAFTEFTGWKVEEVIGKTSFDLKIWAEPADIQRQTLINKLKENGSIRNHEFIFQDKYGNKLTGLLSAEIIKIKSEQYMLANVVNVTQRKMMEETLRESEKNYRLLADSTNDVIWKIDFKHTINIRNMQLTYVSPSAERITGFLPQEVLKLKLSDILTNKSINKSKKILQLVINKEKNGKKVKGQTLELEHFCKNGSVKWMECNMSFLRDEEGDPNAIIGVGRDITERKQIEKEKEKYFKELKFISDTIIELNRMDDVDRMCQYIGQVIRSVNKNAYVLVLLYDPDLDAIRIRSLTGFDKVKNEIKKIIGTDLSSILFYPDQLSKKIHELYTVGKLQYISEGLCFLFGEKFNDSICKDIERLLEVDDIYTIGFTQEEIPYGGITIFIPSDYEIQFKPALETLITHFSVLVHRKQIENLLWDSKERYQNFINQSFEGIYRQELEEPVDISLPAERQIDLIYDNAYIAECNQAMASMYQLNSPDDLIGKRMIEFHGGKNNPVNRAAVRKFIKSNYRIMNEETEETVSNNRVVYFSNNTIGIIDKGYLTRMWGTQIDITERKQAEEQIKKDLEEKNILLREIHHRVKNNLQIIRSLIHIQLADEKNAAFKASATELSNRVLSMAMIHEQLYSTENLSEINIKFYLESLINRILQSYTYTHITIKRKIEEVYLSIEKSIPIGLMVNELITNAVKHAFPEERKGNIIITLTKNQNVYEIKVKDDGIGMPKRINFQNPSTLGLKLVTILAEQLDGKVRVYRRKGTSIKCTFPLKSD